jgi:hypothetical protein
MHGFDMIQASEFGGHARPKALESNMAAGHS